LNKNSHLLHQIIAKLLPHSLEFPIDTSLGQNTENYSYFIVFIKYFFIIRSAKCEFLYWESGRCGGEKLEEYFGNLQENLPWFERQAGECKQKGLKPVYNPAVCTEGDTYEPSANCKCVDENNNCKECYGKVKC
jgi:hypothetical protein